MDSCSSNCSSRINCIITSYAKSIRCHHLFFVTNDVFSLLVFSLFF